MNGQPAAELPRTPAVNPAVSLTPASDVTSATAQPTGR